MLPRTIALVLVMVVASTFANRAPLPDGIADLLAATPTMLSPLKKSGNTSLTIANSQIVFGDKPTLIATIESLIENSELSAISDGHLAEAIAAVLGADGATVDKLIRAALACRAHKEVLHACVQALVDEAMPADDVSPSPTN